MSTKSKLNYPKHTRMWGTEVDEVSTRHPLFSSSAWSEILLLSHKKTYSIYFPCSTIPQTLSPESKRGHTIKKKSFPYLVGTWSKHAVGAPECEGVRHVCPGVSQVQPSLVRLQVFPYSCQLHSATAQLHRMSSWRPRVLGIFRSAPESEKQLVTISRNFPSVLNCPLKSSLIMKSDNYQSWILRECQY